MTKVHIFDVKTNFNSCKLEKSIVEYKFINFKKSCSNRLNLAQNIYPKKAHEGSANLDTLAQLAKLNTTPLKTNGLQNLKKRAKAKFISDIITLKLADLQNTKKAKQKFYNTYHCTRLIEQQGQKLTSHYCNNRWCIVCNRIRAAKLIAGYSVPLSKLDSPYMVTLTIPNVQKNILDDTIDLMFANLNRIRKLQQKRKKPIIGIRKFEITYNSDKQDFHPHFHLIVNSEIVANDVVNEWLRFYPSAVMKAQDIRKADMNSMFELFKYFTKMFSKTGVNIKALDVMIRSLQGRRVVQPMGIKKYVSEDIDEIESVIYSELDNIEYDVWEFIDYDWYSRYTGEKMTDFEPSDVLLEMKEKIR